MFDVACFFLPSFSHLSLNVHVHIHVCMYVYYVHVILFLFEIKADLFVPTTDSGGRRRIWPVLKSPPSKTKDSGVQRGSETRTGETGEEMVVFIPAVS